MTRIFSVGFLGLVLGLTISSNAIFASSDAEYDWDLAGHIAVQHGGRVKPLNTFARELVQQVHGKSSFDGQHPVETYFHWMSDGEYWADQKLFHIGKGPLRDALDLPKDGGNYFEMSKLQSNLELMQLARGAFTADQAGEKPTFEQNKANELLGRMNILSEVFTHSTPRFVPQPGGDPETNWANMPEVLDDYEDSTLVPGNEAQVDDARQALAIAFSGMYLSLRDERPDMFNTSARVFLSTQSAMLAPAEGVSSRVKWENVYNTIKPYTVAKFLLLSAFVLLALSLKASWAKVRWPGVILLIGGFLYYTLGMSLRAYVSGRAPWSNMYESLLAIGWSLLLIAIIYEFIRRDRVLAMVGSLLGVFVLGIAQYASLDRGINPLVPALQSYWLNYHVIITLSSYSCFAIAMGMGHAVLAAAVKTKGQVTPTVASLAKANLKIIQLGTLLLITGILLGAVWANVSWGRFWGWDPKETWALITWFVYVVFLHGRSAGWLGWRGLAAYSVGAFPVVIMTYYGVNFYLSGLHSYGAGSAPGIPWQLFAYMGLETVFLIWALGKLKGTVPKRPKPGGSSSQSVRPQVVRASEVS